MTARRHLAVPFTAVELQDGLWAPRQARCASAPCRSSTPNTRRTACSRRSTWIRRRGRLRIPFNSRPNTAVMYWDSDIAKWIEMASYTLATHHDPALDAQIDDLVARIAKAQQPDGYFNSYFIRREPAKRWTNLRDWHELYCAGHMIEAAVAHAQATGKQACSMSMRRYADYIATVFGPGPGQRRGYCGHPEIELALVKLYRFTGERRYLDLAKFFIDERGRQPHYFDQEAVARGDDPAAQYYGTYEYSQSHVPVREQHAVVGHAVRAMYLYSAMADLAGEFDDASLMAACKTLWADLTAKRLYVTGGLGPSARNEGFTADYDLPNETAYAETCAAVGLVFWAHRMLLVERDARYADMMELALYNGALERPVARRRALLLRQPARQPRRPSRWTWHRCPCCPPNIGRSIASLGQYVYSTATRRSWPCISTSQSKAQLSHRRHERDVRADDAVSVGRRHRASRSSRSSRREFALRLRIPGWCRSAALQSTAQPSTSTPLMDRGYAQSSRRWQKGDMVDAVARPCRPSASTPIRTCSRRRAASR